VAKAFVVAVLNTHHHAVVAETVGAADAAALAERLRRAEAGGAIGLGGLSVEEQRPTGDVANAVDGGGRRGRAAETTEVNELIDGGSL